MSLNRPWNLGTIKCNDVIDVCTDVSELALNWAVTAWIAVQVSQLWNASLADRTKASMTLLSVCIPVHQCLTHAAVTTFHRHAVLLLYWLIKSRLYLAISHPTFFHLSSSSWTEIFKELSCHVLCIHQDSSPGLISPSSIHCFSDHVDFCPKSLLSLRSRQGALPPLDNCGSSLNSILLPQPWWQPLVLAVYRKCPLCSLNEVCGSPPH